MILLLRAEEQVKLIYDPRLVITFGRAGSDWSGQEGVSQVFCCYLMFYFFTWVVSTQVYSYSLTYYIDHLHTFLIYLQFNKFWRPDAQDSDSTQ